MHGASAVFATRDDMLVDTRVHADDMRASALPARGIRAMRYAIARVRKICGAERYAVR